jgi:site-specific DNA-methyltransferase (adenine-specific)
MCVELKHPAMMPKWLARDLIISWSNPGDVVLDPFLGSGTVALEGLKLGRTVIGIEKNPDYVPVIEECLKGHRTE